MATETFPASFGQERLWILDRLEGAGATYHVPLVVEMDRGCDATALERALNYVIERHESLRTTFVADAHGVRQAVHDELRVAIHQVDLSGSDELSWKQRAASDIAHPFDLAHGPLIRATLYRLDGGHCVLLVVLHHIIVDGWSEDVLLRDLAAAYGGTTGQLSSLPIQYADFAVWQRDTVEADERDEHGHRHFWRERLAGTTPTQLPVDWLTTPDERFAGRRHNITVDPNLTSDIRGFLRSEQATLFLTGLTAFAVTAGRYASCQDVLVATPVAGRDRAELRDLIGFFVNTLPVRIHLAPDDTSPALLASVKRMLQETLDHAEYPFERIVQALPTSERRLSPVNLLFGLVPPPGTHGVEHGWRRAKADAELLSGTAKFDFLLFLVDEGSTLRIVIEHSVAFEAETIMAIGATYLRVLSEMVRHSDRRLRDWQIVAREDGPGRRPAEGAAVAFRVDQEFDSQASRTPDAPAVVADHRTLTYRELRQAAEAVAQRIRHATESAVVALLT